MVELTVQESVAETVTVAAAVLSSVVVVVRFRATFSLARAMTLCLLWLS